jgi:hypothetical protein
MMLCMDPVTLSFDLTLAEYAAAVGAAGFAAAEWPVIWAEPRPQGDYAPTRAAFTTAGVVPIQFTCGLGVPGHEEHRPALPAPANQQRRRNGYPWVVDRGVEPIVASGERAVVVTPHLAEDVDRLLQAFESLTQGRKRYPHGGVLEGKPGRADAKNRPPARQDVEGRQHLREVAGMALRHTGNERSEGDLRSRGGQIAQLRVVGFIRADAEDGERSVWLRR